MTARRTPPETASVAASVDGTRLSAPSAQRNVQAIEAVLHQFAPSHGRALEIASGTGQHIIRFAQALPDLIWQPSDVEADRLASIDAWASTVAAGNLHAAILLNAARPGWSDTYGGQDLILLVNLLHLIREDEARTVIAEAALALNPGGRLMVYGPFKRAGDLTSEGDVQFDASLRAADPAIGYKDDFDIIDWMHTAGLSLLDVVEMPANNLMLIAERED